MTARRCGVGHPPPGAPGPHPRAFPSALLFAQIKARTSGFGQLCAGLRHHGPAVLAAPTQGRLRPNPNLDQPLVPGFLTALPGVRGRQTARWPRFTVPLNDHIDFEGRVPSPGIRQISRASGPYGNDLDPTPHSRYSRLNWPARRQAWHMKPARATQVFNQQIWFCRRGKSRLRSVLYAPLFRKTTPSPCSSTSPTAVFATARANPAHI